MPKMAPQHCQDLLSLSLPGKREENFAKTSSQTLTLFATDQTPKPKTKANQHSKGSDGERWGEWKVVRYLFW